jgi:hypothetical protein
MKNPTGKNLIIELEDIDIAPENEKQFKEWCEKLGFHYLGSRGRTWCPEFGTYFRGSIGIAYTKGGESFLVCEDDFVERKVMI